MKRGPKKTRGLGPKLPKQLRRGGPWAIEDMNWDRKTRRGSWVARNPCTGAMQSMIVVAPLRVTTINKRWEKAVYDYIKAQEPPPRPVDRTSNGRPRALKRRHRNRRGGA